MFFCFAFLWGRYQQRIGKVPTTNLEGADDELKRVVSTNFSAVDDELEIASTNWKGADDELRRVLSTNFLKVFDQLLGAAGAATNWRMAATNCSLRVSAP